MIKKSSPISNIVNSFKELELDIKPDVTEAMLFLTGDLPAPTELMSTPELEKAILKMSDQHYEVAKLKRRGHSVQRIAQETGLSVIQVNSMISRVLNLGFRMIPQYAEELRGEVLQQLDDFLYGLHEEALSAGSQNLTSKQIPAALGILDRKIKLLGINPPERVELTMSEEILQAKTQLANIIERYSGSIIDVTPSATLEESNDNT